MTNSEREELAAELEEVIGDFLRSKGILMNGAMCRRVDTEAHVIADMAKKKLDVIEADSVWNEAIKRTCTNEV